MGGGGVPDGRGGDLGASSAPDPRLLVAPPTAATVPPRWPQSLSLCLGAWGRPFEPLVRKPGVPLEPKVCSAEGRSPASFLGRDGGLRPPVSPRSPGKQVFHPISPFLLGLAAFLTTRTSIYPQGGRHPRVPNSQGAFRFRTHCRGGRVQPRGEHVTGGDSRTGCRRVCGTGRVTDPPETILMNRGMVSVVDSATPARGADHKPCQALVILRLILVPPTTPNSPLTHRDPGQWEGLLPLI